MPHAWQQSVGRKEEKGEKMSSNEMMYESLSVRLNLKFKLRPESLTPSYCQPEYKLSLPRDLSIVLILRTPLFGESYRYVDYYTYSAVSKAIISPKGG